MKNNIEKQIGLVGVGTMGRVIFDRLLSSGFTVYASDPVLKTQEYITAQGGRLEPNAAAVVWKCAFTVLCLPAPKHIHQVVLGDGGALEAAGPGKIIVDTSTVDPDTTRIMAKVLQEKGTLYLDAPILGRPSTIGNWILPVGGKKEGFEKVKDILSIFTKQIVHAGPSGAGNTFKLLNQLMFSTINGITAEVFAIAQKAGVDTALFYHTVADSGAATVSGLFKECGKRIVAEEYLPPVFPVDMLIKDAGLGIEMARKLGTPPVIATAVQVLNEIASGKGLGALDTSALVKVYSDLYKESK